MSKPFRIVIALSICLASASCHGTLKRIPGFADPNEAMEKAKVCGTTRYDQRIYAYQVPCPDLAVLEQDTEGLLARLHSDAFVGVFQNVNVYFTRQDPECEPGWDPERIYGCTYISGWDPERKKAIDIVINRADSEWRDTFGHELCHAYLWRLRGPESHLRVKVDNEWIDKRGPFYDVCERYDDLTVKVPFRGQGGLLDQTDPKPEEIVRWTTRLEQD